MIDVLKSLIKQFMPFAQEKMGFSRPPRLFLRQDEQNAANPMGKTGFYDAEKESITLYTTGRHPKDIMRSLAHELQHHTQKCNGEFENIQSMGEEGYAQNDPHMRTMEIQAYQASIVFRDWEDSCKGTIYYEHLQKGDKSSMSTKKWKNQELKSLLAESWGFKMDLNKLNEKLGDGNIDKDDDEKAGIEGADPENVGRGDVAAEAGVRGDEAPEETIEEMGCSHDDEGSQEMVVTMGGDEEHSLQPDEGVDAADHAVELVDELRDLIMRLTGGETEQPMEEGGLADRPEGADKAKPHRGRRSGMNEQALRKLIRVALKDKLEGK